MARASLIFLVAAFCLLNVVANAHELCPITGKPPAAPTVPHFRCPAANNLSCCSDCDDISTSLNVLNTKLSDVVAQLAPQFASLIPPTLQICDLFTGFSQCQLDVEALLCAVNCDPNADSYLTKEKGIFTMRVCSGFADSMYNSCSNVSLNGLALSLLASDASSFLETIFDNVVKTLGLKNFKSVVVSTDCYDGSTPRPSEPFCCDTFADAKSCPAGTISSSDAKLIGRPVNSSVCSEYAQPPSSPVTLSPPPPKSAASTAISGVAMLAAAAAFAAVF